MKKLFSEKAQLYIYLLFLIDIVLYFFAFSNSNIEFISSVLIILSIPLIVFIRNYKSSLSKKRDDKEGLILSGILLVTGLLYIPSLKYGFTNWDDPEYVINNYLIRNFSFENISDIFSLPFKGMYQPLSIISLMFDYLPAKLNPLHYHLTNTILHILNTLLVYKIIKLLFSNINIAIITAILFGLHPVHTESVIWITERKDVLFSFFFLLSLYQYSSFLKSKSNQKYLISIIFFILSLLAKPQGVMLAFVIILTDYLWDNKEVFKKTQLTRKIPYFLLALFFGVLTIILGEGETKELDILPRAVYSLFAYSAYIFQLIIPYNLSAIYPYPDAVSMVHVLGSGFAIFVSIGSIYIFRKHKEVIYGILFFTLNIVLLLQIIPNTYVLRADRYNYLPAIGIFILIGLFYNYLITRFNKQNKLIRNLLLSFIVIMLLSSFMRGTVWQSSISLWDDTLNKYPEIAEALNNRGHAYSETGKTNLAIKDFNKALKIDPNLVDANINRGTLYLNSGDYEKAMLDFNHGLNINPENVNGLINRGITYKDKGDYENAMSDFSNAISLNRFATNAYINRGTLYEFKSNYNKAIKDYNSAIQIEPKRALIYSNRGLAYARSGHEELALKDFNTCIELDPGYVDAYSNRGFTYYKRGQYYKSITDFGNAIRLRPNFATAYMNRGNAYISVGNTAKACEDYQTAYKLGIQTALHKMQQYCTR